VDLILHIKSMSITSIKLPKHMPAIPALGRWRQEDNEFTDLGYVERSRHLDYMARHCFKKKK
jgi:hypothetical protein